MPRSNPGHDHARREGPHYPVIARAGKPVARVVLPFGDQRSQALRRAPEFLDLREEIQESLFAEVTEV